MGTVDLAALEALKMREQYRDSYWSRRDPIYEDRLLWRAHSFRQMVHLLPSESILELGAGSGLLTRQLLRISRGENPITAVTFNDQYEAIPNLGSAVTWHYPNSFRWDLNDQFDHVIAMDLLDKRNCSWVLQQIYERLKPGGQMVLYESNPWNMILTLRHALQRLHGTYDPRRLLARPELFELISEIGFIKVFSVYNDFVYRPFPRSFMWFFRHLSTLLENMPGVRTLAGSIFIHAQKPPRAATKPVVSICDHRTLYGSISVVIPCHNEEMNILPLIRRLKEMYGSYLHEIIPVEDNSQDKTAALLHDIAAEEPLVKPVFRAPPGGVGRALADGYQKASGRYVLSMDCDFIALLPELRDLFDAASNGYDVVIGSRFSRHSVLLNYPFKKILANRAFHVLAQLVLLRRFRDVTNNLKLMRLKVVQRLRICQPHFAANAEIGLEPILMGYSVKEVPISWINRTPDMGVSSFKLASVGRGYLAVLLRLSYERWLGKFQ